MARVTFNANAAEMKTGGALLPKNRYLLKVVEVQDTDKDGNVLTTKNGARQMAVLELTPASGEFADKRRFWHYLTFIPAGEPGHGIALSCLSAFGMPHDGEIDFDLQDLKDRVAEADVDVEASTTVNPKTGQPYDPKNVVKRWHSNTDEELAAKLTGQVLEEQPYVESAPVATAPAPIARPVAQAPARPVATVAKPVVAGKLPWKR